MFALHPREVKLQTMMDASAGFSELPLCFVAAVMLFPNNERRIIEYLCLGILDLETKLLDAQPSNQDHIVKIFGEAIIQLFSARIADEYRKAGLTAPSHAGAALRQFHACLQGAQFPVSGKGSIRERMARGYLAGLMLSLALLEDLSLTKAAERIEEISPSIRACHPDFFVEMPIVSASNLQQNIWPEFKDVAHLWASFQDFSYEKSSFPDQWGLIHLDELAEWGRIMPPTADGRSMELIPLTMWPSQYAGWRAFIWKAQHIFNTSFQLGLRKYAGKPLLNPATCWRIFL